MVNPTSGRNINELGTVWSNKSAPNGSMTPFSRWRFHAMDYESGTGPKRPRLRRNGQISFLERVRCALQAGDAQGVLLRQEAHSPPAPPHARRRTSATVLRARFGGRSHALGAAGHTRADVPRRGGELVDAAAAVAYAIAGEMNAARSGVVAAAGAPCGCGAGHDDEDERAAAPLSLPTAANVSSNARSSASAAACQ